MCARRSCRNRAIVHKQLAGVDYTGMGKLSKIANLDAVCKSIMIYSCFASMTINNSKYGTTCVLFASTSTQQSSYKPFIILNIFLSVCSVF